MPGLPFESQLTIEVSAQVTHPPGTTFDDQGRPIPPQHATEETKEDRP